MVDRTLPVRVCDAKNFMMHRSGATHAFIRSHLTIHIALARNFPSKLRQTCVVRCIHDGELTITVFAVQRDQHDYLPVVVVFLMAPATFLAGSFFAAAFSGAGRPPPSVASGSFFLMAAMMAGIVALLMAGGRAP